MLLITILVELLCASRKKPNAGRWPTGAVALRTAWSEHGMASVNQTWPHCVNQMEKTHSKSFSGTAWLGNGMGMECQV
jgi:hypothetical protein